MLKVKSIPPLLQQANTNGVSLTLFLQTDGSLVAFSADPAVQEEHVEETTLSPTTLAALLASLWLTYTRVGHSAFLAPRTRTTTQPHPSDPLPHPPPFPFTTAAPSSSAGSIEHNTSHLQHRPSTAVLSDLSFGHRVSSASSHRPLSSPGRPSSSIHAPTVAALGLESVQPSPVVKRPQRPPATLVGGSSRPAPVPEQLRLLMTETQEGVRVVVVPLRQRFLLGLVSTKKGTAWGGMKRKAEELQKYMTQQLEQWDPTSQRI